MAPIFLLILPETFLKHLNSKTSYKFLFSLQILIHEQIKISLKVFALIKPA